MPLNEVLNRNPGVIGLCLGNEPRVHSFSSCLALLRKLSTKRIE
jgi:hypothetical protein